MREKSPGVPPLTPPEPPLTYEFGLSSVLLTAFNPPDATDG